MHISISQVTNFHLQIAYTISQIVIYIIFSFQKKFDDRNGQKHDPRQEIPKIYVKQFS